MATLDFLNFPEDKKWWKNDENIKPELNDVPIIKNRSENIKNSDWCLLHDKLSQTIIDFFKEHGLPEDAYSVSFGFDSLKESVEYGKPCPVSDSNLFLYKKGHNHETIIESM